MAFSAGTAAIYVIGLPWLYSVLSSFAPETLVEVLGTSDVLAATVTGGVLPFLIGDALKAVLAAALLPAFWAVQNKTHR